MTNDIAEVQFHYIGKGTIKLINFTLMLIGDTLSSSSNSKEKFLKSTTINLLYYIIYNVIMAYNMVFGSYNLISLNDKVKSFSEYINICSLVA